MVSNAITITPEEFKELIKERVLSYIEEERWAWSRETKRKSGEVVNSPRNIIDTQNLYDNLVDFELDIEDEVVHIYLSDYASLVESGFTANGVDYPERPYVRDALESLGLKYTIS